MFHEKKCKRTPSYTTYVRIQFTKNNYSNVLTLSCNKCKSRLSLVCCPSFHHKSQTLSNSKLPQQLLQSNMHGTYLYIPANIFAYRLWSGSRFCALIVLNPVCSISLPKSFLTDHSLNTSAVLNLLSDRGVAKAQVD